MFLFLVWFKIYKATHFEANKFIFDHALLCISINPLYKYTAMHGTIYVWNAVVMSGWADLLLVVFEFLDKLEFFD